MKKLKIERTLPPRTFAQDVLDRAPLASEKESKELLELLSQLSDDDKEIVSRRKYILKYR